MYTSSIETVIITHVHLNVLVCIAWFYVITVEWLTSGGLTDPVATDTGVVFNLDDGEHLLSLLHELTSLGAVFRTMISQAVVDTERYSREFIFNNSHGRVMSTITTDFKCRWVIHLVQI